MQRIREHRRVLTEESVSVSAARSGGRVDFPNGIAAQEIGVATPKSKNFPKRANLTHRRIAATSNDDLRLPRPLAHLESARRATNGVLSVARSIATHSRCLAQK